MLRTRRILAVLATVLMALAVAACVQVVSPTEVPDSSDTGDQTRQETALDGTEWVLTALDTQDPIEGSYTSLGFSEGRASGVAGCNGYGSEYRATASGAFSLDVLEITLEACQRPPGIMQQEAAYVEALQSIVTYTVMKDRLEMVDGSGRVRLAFLARENVATDMSDLLGRGWRLLSTDGADLGDDEIFTLFFQEEERASGQAGCRGYVASYEAEGGDLGFTTLAMMGDVCLQSPSLMEREAQYTTMLEGAIDARVAEGRLEILTSRGKMLIFEPLPVDAEASLEGTSWELVAFVQDRQAGATSEPAALPESVLAGTSVTALLIDGVEGTVEGSAGCNGYRGGYALDGSAITFGALAATRMACAGPEGIMEQEQRYLALLQEATGYRIYGSQLWLDVQDWQSLVFLVDRGYDLADLMEDLGSQGLTLDVTQEVVDHGFSVPGRLLLLEGAALYGYEFPDSAGAERAFSGVSVDEFSMTIAREEGDLTVEVHSDWLETPHVYHRGRVIVVTGDHPELRSALDRLLGLPLAAVMPGAATATPTRRATRLAATTRTATPTRTRRATRTATATCTATQTPTATATATPRVPACDPATAFPPEEAELIWPQLYEVQPSPAMPGQVVTVSGTGGYLYWDNECGQAWDEAARGFQLFFDDAPVGLLQCYVNMCQANLTVPVHTLAGLHIVAVEGGSALGLSVIAPTATATPTPEPPEIVSFTFDKTEVDPGGSVRLAWTSTRGAQAWLNHWLPYGIAGERQPVAVSGEADVTIGNDERLWHEFRLEVRDERGRTATRSLLVDIRCPYEYFFPRPASWGSEHCPLRPAALTWSAEQRFEHGRMIWQEGLPAESTVEQIPRGPTIYVLYGSDGPGVAGDLRMFEDTWTDAEPESDPSITPPGGLLQPIRGFGKLWRSNAEVHDRLGWATGEEAGFDGAYQVEWGDPQHVAGSRYIRTREGRIIWMDEQGSWATMSP